MPAQKNGTDTDWILGPDPDRSGRIRSSHSPWIRSSTHVHVGRRETCLFSISNHLPRNQCHSPLPVRMQLLPLNCIPRHNCFKYPATNDIDIKDVSFYGVIRSRSSVLFFFFALSNRTRPGALVRNTRHRYPSVRDDGQLTGAVGMGRAICLLVPTGAPWIGRYCRVS